MCCSMGRTLGAGSFGKVKLAEHKLTGYKCAIKIMKRKKIQGAGLDEKGTRNMGEGEVVLEFSWSLKPLYCT
jgi:serine/threonine protein kinase